MLDTNAPMPCPRAADMGPMACGDRRQCSKPCGDAGRVTAPDDGLTLAKRFEPGGPLLGGEVER